LTQERRAPLLIDVREAARLLGCGRTLVYDLIGRGELPVVKLGRLTRIPVPALESLVQSYLDGDGGLVPLLNPGPTVHHRRRS